MHAGFSRDHDKLQQRKDHAGTKLRFTREGKERWLWRLPSVSECVFAQVCHEEALDWAQSRSAFGATLSDFQVLSVSFGLGRHANRHRARQAVRHKLVDMQMQIEAASA